MNATSALESELLAAASGKPPPRPKLLVVDDQPANIQVLYRAFAADHQVFMATSGSQALGLAESHRPDLVLLDVMMPNMDGYEVCRELKAHPATRDIPIIFITGHTDEAAETRGLEAGAVDFISKPINPNVVRARARTHLTLKAQSDLLRQWVYIDGLTGVYNRRHFDERLAAEWSRAVRNGSPLSVVMLDVDFFKRYNDSLGHLAGDACLHAVAGALKSSLQRPGDLVARYGGEEFVCLLPDTGLPGAISVAEKLRQAVLELRIDHPDSAAAPVVTVSLGAACIGATTDARVEMLLRAADRNLYVAKTRGRNQAYGAKVGRAEILD